MLEKCKKQKYEPTDQCWKTLNLRSSEHVIQNPLKKMDDKILSCIDFYNYHRIHLSISYRTPAEMLHRL